MWSMTGKTKIITHQKDIDQYYFYQLFLLILSDMNIQKQCAKQLHEVCEVIIVKGHTDFDSYGIFCISGGYGDAVQKSRKIGEDE
jgi:hypothetical protein